MRTQMSSEERQLEQEIHRLGRALLFMPQPSGLRQRAKSAFIRQLYAYKCERLAAAQEALEQARSKRLAAWARSRII